MSNKRLPVVIFIDQQLKLIEESIKLIMEIFREIIKKVIRRS